MGDVVDARTSASGEPARVVARLLAAAEAVRSLLDGGSKQPPYIKGDDEVACGGDRSPIHQE